MQHLGSFSFSMYDLVPQLGIELGFPALECRVLAIRPPENFLSSFLNNSYIKRILFHYFKVHLIFSNYILGLPGGSVVKSLSANAGNARDAGSIPGSGSPPGRGFGNPLQYSCLENPMSRRAWWTTVLGGHRVRHD